MNNPNHPFVEIPSASNAADNGMTTAPSDFAPLSAMIEEMQGADRLYWPSPFWQKLIAAQVKMLHEAGLENFKRTLNLQYFNWGLKWIVTFLLFPVLRRWMRIHPDFSLLRNCSSNIYEEKHGGLGARYRLANWIYGLYLLLLKHDVERDDHLGLLNRLDEPLAGNPIIVARNGRRISQDLSNSVHEFYSSTSRTGLDNSARPFHVAELGAGYGRLGFVFLNACPNCTYTVIDIPPALFVAQNYLQQVFPEKRVFRFRAFSSYEEIKAEFEASQIRIVAAHQIRSLPDQSVDLFLNISSLHEMTREQIGHYFLQISRLTRLYFYTKQWKKSRTGDLNGFRIGENEYPVPSTWHTVYHQTHPLHRWFFHALYQLGRQGGARRPPSRRSDGS